MIIYLKKFISVQYKAVLAFIFLTAAVCGAKIFAEQTILGIDRIQEYEKLFRNKKIGLITNQTGINSKGESSVEILKKAADLKALFSPEHGIRGAAREGAFIKDTVDKKTGLKVFSLYGGQKKPSAEMLKELDILCFDIQDTGARFYTYIYTMAYAMEACAENGKTFIVFDRPNPINGTDIEGLILQEEYKSFVGLYPILQRHGMTIGELALLFNKEFSIGCELKIIPMKNWQRSKYFESTELIWVPPSPNIPNAETALLYSGICLFEGVNISVGRGSTMPFRYIGAPFIEAEELSTALNSLNLAGVLFLPAYFEPSASLYKNSLCKGVHIVVTDKKIFKPVRTAVAMLFKIREMYPSHFSVNNAEQKRCGLNLLFGSGFLTSNKKTLPQIFSAMEDNEKEFSYTRKKYLLY